MFLLRPGLYHLHMQEKLSWIGTVSSVLGSFVIAFGFMLAGYSLFLVGAGAWLHIGFTRMDKPLITLNGFFAVANIIGLARAIYAI